jgi:hypothetical protein
MIDYEEIMKQWDSWRKYIADGGRTSAPRDWFESILEYCLELEEELKSVSNSGNKSKE